MGIHHRLAKWLRTNVRTVDRVAASGLFLVLAVIPYVLAGLDLPAFLFSTALVVPLAWRRTHPWQAGTAVAAVSFLQLAAHQPPLPAQVSVLVVVYALAAYAPRWASLGGLATALLGMGLGVIRYADSWGGSPAMTTLALDIIACWAVTLVCWTFGDLARNRRLTLQALQDRARRLEVEQQQERELAAADERSHIAREMHDIVAHSLSVIITQADGARYASGQRPELARETLGTIADTGRSSLREMRRLLGVLRSDDQASTRPLPTLDDLPDLLDAVGHSGLPIGAVTDGAPRRPLPTGAGLTAYRIVQESLTNVLKHAGPGAAATVRLAWTAKGLDVHVRDDGRGAGADAAGSGTGQGIRGMRERLSLYDGTLQAGPVPGGGYGVHAFIPYSEA